MPDEIGSQVGQPIVLAFRETVFDRDVLALDEPRLVQAPPKCDNQMRERGRPTGVENSDDWFRRLLRARRERPPRRAAYQGDKIPSPHGRPYEVAPYHTVR